MFMRMDQRQPELPEAMNALLPHLFQNQHRTIRSQTPDMKRPVTSPVIKNAEVKAGKETVRTNIRQEQQVKSVARTNQPNVAESRSNRKKTTVQKQVNQKQNRKSVTKQPEKGRKK